MKKVLLSLLLFTPLLCACNVRLNSSISTSSSSNAASMPANGDTIKIDLNSSNFNRYISCTKREGYTGVAGYSPYEAWLEFKGLLTIGIYDVTVAYTINDTPYKIKLDVSGGGKTDYFDRSVDCEITKVSGSVEYIV